MLSKSSVFGLAMIALVALGCSKSADSGSGQTAPPAAIPPVAAPTSDAKALVTSFLDAFRRGDNEAAVQFLTKVARQKVEEKGLAVAPAANDHVKVEVEDATFPTPDHQIAHVAACWIDVDGMGTTRKNKTIWVCRLESEGWRVAGFAAYAFEGEDPVLFNFEDLDEFAKKQQWLRDEWTRRDKLQSAAAAAAEGENSAQAEKTPKDAFRR